MSVKSFLGQLKATKPSAWVTGNQSADLDSVVSAISYAYFNFKLNQTFVAPLINIPKQDFQLRRDIKLVLDQQGVTSDLLYFIEDFQAMNSHGVVDLALVDHCNLQGGIINANINVNAIIDHHEDEKVFLQSQPRIIRPCGSCSSLVFNYWYNQLKASQINLIGDDIIQLLLAPLIIDTSNMTQKVENDDIEAFKAYQELSSVVNTSINTFYKQIKTAKKDLSGFQIDQVLRKDYKQFEFNGINVGFSSIGKSIDWIFQTYTNKEIQQGLRDICGFYLLDLLIITPSYTVKEQYRREVIIYQVTNTVDNLLNDLHLLQLNDDVYNMHTFKHRLQDIGLKVKNQQNLSASRKQIVPAVKQVLTSNL